VGVSEFFFWLPHTDQHHMSPYVKVFRQLYEECLRHTPRNLARVPDDGEYAWWKKENWTEIRNDIQSLCLCKNCGHAIGAHKVRDSAPRCVGHVGSEFRQCDCVSPDPVWTARFLGYLWLRLHGHEKFGTYRMLSQDAPDLSTPC